MSSEKAKEPAATRVTSVNAYRGFVMFLMMAEVLRLRQMADAFPKSDVWEFFGASSDACRMARLFITRLDPAVVFVLGRRRLALLLGEQTTSRRTALALDIARDLAIGPLGVFRDFFAFNGKLADELYI